MPYTEYESREEWVKSFSNRLGASEIGIVCGYASYKTPIQLWEEKTGRRKAADISDNERVSYGSRAEEHLRALFMLKHEKRYDLEYHPLRVYYGADKPFLTATLDGELYDKETEAKGIYECKTAYIQSKAEFAEWQDRIPDKYYCQICQQMFVTGYDFAILNAELRFMDGKSEIREYRLDRADMQDDIDYIVERGAEFWNYVATNKMPPLKIRI